MSVVSSSHRFRGPCPACSTRDIQPKSYTLAEIEKLAREFIGYADADNYEKRLFLSVLIAWLKKREKEDKDEYQGHRPPR